MGLRKTSVKTLGPLVVLCSVLFLSGRHLGLESERHRVNLAVVGRSKRQSGSPWSVLGNHSLLQAVNQVAEAAHAKLSCVVDGLTSGGISKCSSAPPPADTVAKENLGLWGLAAEIDIQKKPAQPVRRERILPSATFVNQTNINVLREGLRSTRYPTGMTGPGLAVSVHHFHQPSIPDDVVESVVDADVLYLIKACKKFEQRAQEMYKSWACNVSNVIFSTDQTLSGIPEDKQLTMSFSDLKTQIALTVSGPKKASCLVSLLNLGEIVANSKYQNVKWLMILDDDTFVIPRNLMEYLSVFPSAQPWYLGLSNAEVAGIVLNHRLIPITASAPGVAVSRNILERLRNGDEGLQLANIDYIYGLCARSWFKDDVAIGFIPVVLYRAPYVARPDLRGYHFKSMKDPTHLKPLTIHLELQDFPKGIAFMYKQQREKYKHFF